MNLSVVVSLLQETYPLENSTLSRRPFSKTRLPQYSVVSLVSIWSSESSMTVFNGTTMLSTAVMWIRFCFTPLAS
ncbi:MAG: hypothetical protein K2H16_06490 [Prevotella sp.]|nr:hypothetical protein [Prevotella sp.]